MKLTKSELKQIIKEETLKLLSEEARLGGDGWRAFGPGPDSTPEQRQEYLSMQKAGHKAGVRGEEPEFPDNEIYMESYEDGARNRKLRFGLAGGLFLEDIDKDELNRIIKEELANVLNEERAPAGSVT